MIEFLLSLFKPRSVNAIVSDFTKKIEELEKAQTYQKEQEKKEQQAASDALKRAEAAKIESARAQTIKDKINALLG